MSTSPDTQTDSRGPRGLGCRLWGFATTAGLIAAGVLACVMLAPMALGLERYVITGGSMDGTIDRGSVVFEEVVPVDELEVGDVITYEPPPSAEKEGLVTHRIVALSRPAGGHFGDRGPVIRTKGDANESTDPWRFHLVEENQARVVAHVPYVGYVLAALAMREVRMALVGVPALLIGLVLLVGLWRDAGEEARRRASAAAVVEEGTA